MSLPFYDYSSYCNHTTFFDPPVYINTCEVAQQNCQHYQTFVNFYVTTYCHMDGEWVVFLFLMILFIFLIFRVMSLVVESYLAPSIEFLTEAMGLSEALGAVTLLALANGAGDVVTAIVASGSPDGVDYNIGALYGAGLFVTTIVVGITIINAKTGVQLEEMSIWRDVGFYILATIVMIIFGAFGTLHLYDGVILLSLYIVLVILVVIQEKCFPKQQLREEEQPLAISEIENPNPKSLLKQRFQKAVKKVQLQNKINNLLMMKLEKVREEKEKSFAELSFCDKIFFIIDYPFVYMLKITIPPAEEDSYSKLWCTLSITPSIVLAVLTLLDNAYWWMLYGLLPLGIVISLVVWFTYPNDKPIPPYYAAIQTYVTFASLIWTYFISSILIDLLTFFGMLTNLSTSYLGMTVIAMGNALPDGIVTIALAKQGHAIMGLTGAYVGQLFGLLVGMGFAIIRRTLEAKTETELSLSFDLFGQYGTMQENIIMLIVIMTTLFVLLITFTYGIVKKYFFGRDLSLFLTITYVIMFIGVTGIAIYQAINPPNP